MRLDARVWMSLLAGLVVLLPHETAKAQFPEMAGIEGYVFDLRTGRPLNRAVVGFKAADGVNGGSSETDSNGFFSFEVNAAFAWSTTITATCKSRGRTVTSRISIYNQLREGSVYKRNLYLNLPPTPFACEGISPVNPTN